MKKMSRPCVALAYICVYSLYIYKDKQNRTPVHVLYTEEEEPKRPNPSTKFFPSLL